MADQSWRRAGSQDFSISGAEAVLARMDASPDEASRNLDSSEDLRGGHRPDAPSPPRNTLTDKDVGSAGRDVVSPLRGVTASHPLSAELSRLNDLIDEACDQGDLNAASRLNARARRLALEVFSSDQCDTGG